MRVFSGCFVGYDDESKEVRIYFLEPRRIGVKREVVYDRTNNKDEHVEEVQIEFRLLPAAS
jgi:hypothetical protein